MVQHYWHETVEDGVVLARYANPPLNYYVDEAVGELAGRIASWSDERVRAVVLAGTGDGAFITHFSPEQILASIQDKDAVVRAGSVRSRLANGMLDSLSELPVPVIAALDGDAMGFGLELALACDLRIAQAGDHLYGFPEVRMGILPGAGGTQRLARLVGLGRALDLVLRSRAVSPQEAHRLGIVSEVAEDAVASALRIARELAQLPRLSIAVAKRALHRGIDAPLATGLAIESDANARSKLGPDPDRILRGYVAMSPQQRRRWLAGDGGD